MGRCVVYILIVRSTRTHVNSFARRVYKILEIGYHEAMPTAMTPDDLRAWRKAHGYSMRRLAEALDLHYYSFYRWEKGINPMPGRWLDLALERLACESKPRATTPTEG